MAKVAVRKTVVGNGLLNNLVAFWPLNEDSGDALEIGGGQTLTADNAPGADTGKVYATARTLAKVSNQGFHCHTYAKLRGGADFTYMCWFWLTSHPGNSPNYYMLQDSIYGNTGWALGLVDNGLDQLFVQAAHAGGYYTAHSVSVDLPLETWHLAVCWYDHANMTIWVQLNAADPVSHEGAAQMAAQSAYEEAHYFGTEGSGLFMDGRLGPVGLWDRILSVDERAALWNGGAGLAYSAFTA